MSLMSAYEKLVKEGKLNKPIHIQQPTPDNPNGGMSSDGDYNRGIKNIISEKVENNNLNSQNLNELSKLEQRVKLLEDTLEMVMEQHMKLMKRK